jgi:cholesterol transport system auxiliary component
MMSTVSWVKWMPMCLLLLGCQVLPDRPPRPAVHDFGPVPSAAANTIIPWSAVSVEAPEWLHDPLIRYRLLYSQPTQVRFYSLDRWVAPPPELLASRLAASNSTKGYELRLSLQTFEQVFEAPDRSVVQLNFQASAIDPQTAQRASLRVFRFSRPARSADAAGAVESISRLVEQALAELAKWMNSLPPPSRALQSPAANGSTADGRS